MFVALKQNICLTRKYDGGSILVGKVLPMTVHLIMIWSKNNRSQFVRLRGGYFCVLESCCP